MRTNFKSRTVTLTVLTSITFLIAVLVFGWWHFLSITEPALMVSPYVNNSSAAQIQTKDTPAAEPVEMKTFSAEELAQYNGTDPNKPILLAMDGEVYDVTAGKKFYAEGGSYHRLAGRDASEELAVAGGGIIKQKYPVVGTLKAYTQ